jgi:hypothetical protein
VELPVSQTIQVNGHYVHGNAEFHGNHLVR